MDSVVNKINHLFSKQGLYYFIYYSVRLFGIDRIMSDKLYLKLKYRCYIGKKLNLSSPTTFNEKLNWLKLYNRKPIYTVMVDKYEVKDYVASIIGSQYIIPTLGVWDKAEDIDWDALPNKFVLKCTHDSGSIVICKDKQLLDIKSVSRKLNKSLRRDCYRSGREWPYKNVKHRIIAEKYMEDKQTKELRDYKFFCFNGDVKCMFIATDRQKEGESVKFDFFDANFVHMNMKHGHDNASILPQKPNNFELMKTLASKLSQDIPFLRVDFYEIDNEVFFGELTFFHHNGTTKFEPDTWDKVLGDWIVLP